MTINVVTSETENVRKQAIPIIAPMLSEGSTGPEKNVSAIDLMRNMISNLVSHQQVDNHFPSF